MNPSHKLSLVNSPCLTKVLGVVLQNSHVRIVTEVVIVIHP